MATPWYEVENAGDVPSPALLVYPDRVRENIRHMIAIAGSVERLRPHLKTSKLPEIVRMHSEQGITRFKVATIAEAEMAATAGAIDVLLAYQPVGPNVARLLRLTQQFPHTRFATLIDDESVARALATAAVAAGVVVPVYLDLDVGMHRSGIEPGPAAAALYRRVAELPGLHPAGLHAYDGHIHDKDAAARCASCDAAFSSVEELRAMLGASSPPVVIAGGTPTFQCHAKRAGVELSPGTTTFWDLNYSTNLPDLDFLPAVMLLTRVVSKPGGDRVCLDLGHKAVASENPHPRAAFMGIDDARAMGHSEEHLVIETAQAAALPVGSVVYAIPWHVCPTVALHDTAVVVRDGRAVDRWAVVARARAISV
jgi:D-serine deaminase-like pyridoxal phosphate-dependent protein